MALKHDPVLLDEVIVQLAPLPGKVYLDGTLGGGGHAEELLKESDPDGRVIGLDVDAVALEQARYRLGKWKGRASVYQRSYAEMAQVLTETGIGRVDGILLDLGVSSFQFDEPERGFSLKKDGPLDMRMDDRTGITAEYVVNEVGRDQLRRIFYKYGEEPKAGRIADKIVEVRRRERITSTLQLAQIVEQVISPRGKRIHPATRVFQAIRMEVNRELDNLKQFLAQFMDLLNPGGRVVIISFHSLEDRLVKDRFRDLARECTCPPELPQCVCDRKPKVKLLTKKPVMAEPLEVDRNPRSRSAKLRAVKKL